MKSQSKKRVFVGMSGGVDSSVSATLLKKAGYDVTGVFIKVWQPDWIECSWREERRDAMRAAAHLNIPFITLDLEKEYKEGVVDHMLEEYRNGRTPNPDVMCNREVKFGAFWRYARDAGADFIATGHYARTVKYPSERYELLAGTDTNKDQSYFLWTLNQRDLEHTIFPVGHLTKPEVRKLARKFGLPNAEKKDSQGLCFMGKVDVKGFLAHYTKAEQGNVLDESGEIVGTHPGAMLFTIGERHGFAIHDKKKTPHESAYFVIDKDIEQNTITVAQRDPTKGLPGATKTVRISRVNWVSGQVPDISNSNGTGDSYPLLARSRYRQPLQRARIASVSFSETALEFKESQDTLTPGQSLVIYDGEGCLGGGVIE